MNFSLRLELNQGPAVICYLYRPTLYQLSYKEFSLNYFIIIIFTFTFYFIIIKKNNFLNELYFYKIKKLFLSLFFIFLFFIFLFFIFLFFYFLFFYFFIFLFFYFFIFLFFSHQLHQTKK